MTSDSASEGTFSLRSQIINAFELASIETTGSFGAGTISFRYKVSTEDDFDSLRFFIDGGNRLTVDGEVDWTEVRYTINAGQRTFRWDYRKDGSVSNGIDTVWIDDFKFTPTNTTPTPAPAPSSGGGGSIPLSLLLLLALLSLSRGARLKE